MPNWCYNNLFLWNDNVEKVRELKDYLHSMLDDIPKLFSFFRPCPVTVERWYDWNIANWGTKWEACNVHFDSFDDHDIQIFFESAWNPPIELYEFIHVKMGWVVEATYYEPGISFIGKFSNGNDECYSIPSSRSLDGIPADLVGEWNLESEQVYSDDEEEESMQRRSTEDPDSEI